MRDRLIELLKKPTPIMLGETTIGERSMPLSTACNLADHLLENGVTVQEWISVKDRLPATDDWVLVCKKTIETGYTSMAVDRCTFTVGGDRMWLAEYATWKQVVAHWMPLPQPPKGE